VAANHAFLDALLRVKDFQEAFHVQAEYFQSQLRSAADDATQLTSQNGCLVQSIKRLSVHRGGGNLRRAAQHVLDKSCTSVAKRCCSLAIASVTFKAQPLLCHALYLFIKLRTFFIEPIAF
jgi:hypothetical protein